MFFVIRKGTVKVIKTIHRNERKEIGQLFLGACFGEMGLLLHDSRTASVLASDECFILQLTAPEVETMPLGTQVKVYRTFLEDLARKLKFTTEDMIRPGG